MPPAGYSSIRIFCDGADLSSIRALASNPLVQGFTTNPTLMRKAGVLNYEAFARSVLSLVPRLPVSFEVFADDETGMEAQAYAIAQWAPNVNVKIPVTDRAGRFQGALIRRLALAGISLNVTAVLTLDHVERVLDVLPESPRVIVSVFAGRIADTGVDPIPMMRRAAEMVHARDGVQLLWASPREVLNLYQAEELGCDIITMPPDLLMKLPLAGKDLKQYSLETVEMFFRDAQAASYSIDVSRVLVAPAVEVPIPVVAQNACSLEVDDRLAASGGAAAP